MDKLDIFVPHHLTNTSLLIQTSTRMWVQAIGLFAQTTCASECWLPRPFNQILLVLHVGGGAVKQRVKFKTNKFQHKTKAISWMPVTVYKYYYKKSRYTTNFYYSRVQSKTTTATRTNLTKEVHDHQMKHQITENKIRKSTLRCKILQ